jgi:superfamily II DNA or RNA helicase
MRRFLRTPAFLARFFPAHDDTGAIAEALAQQDASGMTLDHRFRRFCKFLLQRSEAERVEYLDALDEIQTGERRTRDRKEGDESSARLVANVRLVNGATSDETRRRVLLAFNTPFFPEILVASSVLAEGVDLHLDCRFIIHHDLCWNPSTLEQRTGRVDRLGAKAEQAAAPIHVYLPYVAETQDEKMFRVVQDRERWFQVVMGESFAIDERSTDRQAQRVPLPAALAERLALKLGIEA